MNKNQAQQLIHQLFSSPFDLDRYRHFLRNLLNHYEPRDGHYTGNYIPEAFKQHVKQYWRIGKYVDPQGEQLDLLAVEVKSLTKLERARSALRNFAVNRLRQFEKEASLIAFYAEEDQGADWRFSFVKMEHEAYKDDKGKVKLKQELTPAKRHSFLVGEHENSHTACKQLLPLLEMDYANPRLKDIEDAFSVETVTDEFFDQYKALFQKVAEHLKRQTWFKKGSEEERVQRVSRFAKKLLGQIVFLYFLQKKGWLGVPKNGQWSEGSKRFMPEQYDQVVKDRGNYHHDFLQYLFYEALADERKTQKDPKFYARFNCRVPFLNGGLFEADYDWHKETIDLPNKLFHNDEKTKAGDIGTGILDVFDRYNFTIKEDEPLEKDVAVDPEMLGKVFENMLEVTERKNKGAFYTPREIVHYMCQESLIHYLDNRLNSYATSYCEFDSPQTSFFGNEVQQGQLTLTEKHQDIKVPKAALETLIRKGHLFVENDEAALQALQRIERGEQKTTKHKIELPDSIKAHAQIIDAALADIKVCDPAIGSGAFPVGLLHEIVNARCALAPHSGQTISPYALKRHTIAESIYGVDTDASAIDIARLRLWLSLIVEEVDYDTIEALPNLDYKIIQGDSLIGLREGYMPRGLERLETLKEAFFSETDRNKKAQIKKDIDQAIRTHLETSQVSLGYKLDFDFRLFFSEVWHQKGGFDVVIGNPPYVQIQNFCGQPIQKDWEKQNYETFAKTGDIYCLFYEKGYRLLREQGVLAFITSNKWMRAAYGEKLRKFFIEHTQPLILIDFSSFQVFKTATVDTNVLLFRKQKREGGVQACLIDPSFTRVTPLEAFVARKSIELDNLSGESWGITSRTESWIKKQIEKVGTPLKDWDIAINYGIKTGLNEAFIIDGKKKDEVIAKDPKSAEIIKPILRGRDIKRYRVDFADLWLINTHNGHGDIPPIDVKGHPAIKTYLDQFLSQLKKRQDKGVTPYNLRNCAYLEEFKKEKILYADLSRTGNSFSLDRREVYAQNTCYMMTGKNLCYLLACLNSSVILYYLDLTNQKLDKNGWRWFTHCVEKLPVPKIDSQDRKPFEIMVDYVLASVGNEQKLQFAFFDQLIDGLVYELYFPDEIKAANKAILPHLGELTPITLTMSEEEKLAIIQREFDRLYDPRHPVRNHLETLDSVKVVGTIRQALNR